MSAKKFKASCPAVKNEKEEKLWIALKRHIMKGEFKGTNIPG